MLPIDNQRSEKAETCIGDNQIPVNTTIPGPGYTDTDYTKDQGWAQRPAVHALLGKVYLYMSDFTNAKIEFEKVIGDNRFKLDKPVNFTDYIQHTDNNPECIFSLQYYLSSGSAYEDAPNITWFVFSEELRVPGTTISSINALQRDSETILDWMKPHYTVIM